MKKAEILKIPYLPIKIPKNKKYGIAADVINGILIADCYYHDKAIPEARIAIDKKTWIIYEPETDSWHKKGVKDNYWTNNYAEGILNEDIHTCKKDIKKIRTYGNIKHEYCNKTAFDYIQEIIDSYKNAIVTEKRNRKQKELETRMAEAEGIHSEGFGEWAENLIKLNTKNYIYYKNKGNKTILACSRCGGESEKRIISEGFEDTMMGIYKPQKDCWGICPICGATGTYKQIGHSKPEYTETECYDVIKTEKGICVKYIIIEKKTEPYCKEIAAISDIACNFFDRGKKTIFKTYHVQRYYSNQSWWSYNNLGGYKNIIQEDAPISPGGTKILNESHLKYSMYEEYKKTGSEQSLPAYLQAYVKYPQIERLLKMGMNDMAEALAAGNTCRLNLKEKTLSGIFGIKPDRVNMLKQNGSIKMLKILQFEKKYDIKMPEKELNTFFDIYKPLNTPRYETLIRYINFTKMIHMLTKYSERENKSNDEVLITYTDYLNMRERNGYDMTDPIILFPRDLTEAHDKMVLEENKRKADERIKQVTEKFPGIEKSFKRLSRKYAYSEGGYIIRPAASAGEIVEEGRYLHHCVGGDNYLKKHNDGESYILFLRKAEKPEIPFVTIEISKTGDILQWYEAYDKKTSSAVIQPFLDEYRQKLKEKLNRKKKHTIVNTVNTVNTAEAV